MESAHSEEKAVGEEMLQGASLSLPLSPSLSLPLSLYLYQTVSFSEMG